jgi:hypothetical protein
VDDARGAVRRLAPAALLSLATVAVIVVGVLVASGAAAPAMAFAPTGHWVFNSAENAVVHVDAGTGRLDARVSIPDPGNSPSFAVQGERHGFLVARDKITVFGKSTLTVDSTIPVDQSEVPVPVEVVGGPYLIYRQAGTIVRLGVPPVTVIAGGPLGSPVRTEDGTLWVHRVDNGALCALRRDAQQFDCAVSTQPGEAGGLTVTASEPAFVSTAADAAQLIVPPALGAAVAVGADLPDDVLLADADSGGRLPSLLPSSHRLLLADSSGVSAGRAGGAPVVVDLAPGQYTAPVASGDVVAVLEQTANRLFTFDLTGRALQTVDLPPGGGPAALSRGADGRIYVDDADGVNTHIVEPDGSVTSLATGGPGAVVLASASDAARSVPLPPMLGPGRGGKPTPPLTQEPLPQPPWPTPPDSPKDVRAQLESNGLVTVVWQPVVAPPGETVTYAVRPSIGAPMTTTTTSATFGGLARGVTYRFTVSATTRGKTSAESIRSGAVTIPIGPPQTMAASEIDGGDARLIRYRLSWIAPDMGGGRLDRYVVRMGGVVVQESAATTADVYIDRCGDSSVSVYAEYITGGPDGGQMEKSQSEVMMFMRFGMCVPRPEIFSVTDLGTGTEAEVSFVTAKDPYAAASSYRLLFNGEVKLSAGPVTPAVTYSRGLVVDGLSPGTTYTVELVSSNEFGDGTSNEVTFRTADCSGCTFTTVEDDPVVPTEPEPNPNPEPNPEPEPEPEPQPEPEPEPVSDPPPTTSSASEGES